MMSKSMQKIFYILMFLVGFSLSVQGQDAQFSQFYANQLYLNPAFAGSTGGSRIGMNYRNQWPQLEANYVTYSVAFDHYFENYRSSIGFIAKQDQQGKTTQPFKSTDFALIYSYVIPINETTIIQSALQVGYSLKSLNYSNLLFPDQFNNNGFLGTPTGEEFPKNNVNYIDISAGVVLMGNNYWLGLSSHHLNQPNQSFFDQESKLPTKYSVHGGLRKSYENYYDNLDKSITAAFILESQGAAKRLNLGVYGVYEPFVFGVWYKGIPIQKIENRISNNDALVFLAGLKFGDFNLGYSYDVTVSELARYNAASHELSLVYHFGSENVHCPDPWGTSKKRRSFRR